MSGVGTGLDQAWAEITTIVGREHIRPASAADAVDDMQPSAVIAPGSTQEIAQVLRYCNSAGLAIIPRGGGTKLSLGNPPQKVDFILSTERLNRVVEHAWEDMTATVEAGCAIDKLQSVLKQHGQQLAADPMQPEHSTVGGMLATAESGTLRIRYGAVRDLALGLEMVLADGNVIKAGGKVVKNVAGYDLTKLVIGSLGTLGVITRAVFRLHPVPFATATYSTSLASASDAIRVVLAILDSHLVATGLQMRPQRPDQIALDVRFEGIPESLEEQFNKLGRVAGGQRFTESTGNVWEERQKLFANANNSVVCKCSVLPAQLGSLCDVVFREATPAGVAATLVAQGTGLVELRLDASSPHAQIGVCNALRAEIDRLQGTLIVQQCPASMKRHLDLWGAVKDALPLMRQIKEKFDPGRILNPGRFVGGI